MTTPSLLRFAVLAALLSVPVLAQDPVLRVLGTYGAGIYNEGAAEIVAHDPATQRLFVVNGADRTIDILDASNPSHLRRISQVRIPAEHGRAANSVAVRNGVVAVAVGAERKTDPGSVVFFDTQGRFLNAVRAGALPDMITFTPDGSKVLTANEGEPSDDYKTDPEGSVTIVDLSRGVEQLTQSGVRTADFRRFTRAMLDPAVRVYGPGASVAQDLEPEYIAVSPDSKTAWVTLQENNAVAVVDIESASVTRIAPLGVKEHWRAENRLDAGDRDGGGMLRTWTVWGMYQPDAIAAYTASDGRVYLLTANEGDARAYDGFNEEARVADLKLDPRNYPNPSELQTSTALGRLRVTNATGDVDGDGDFDFLHAFGARSFSVWTTALQQVFDSGDQFEMISAANYPGAFNVSNTDNTDDSRSDDKGPEPEALAIGTVRGKTYAFVGNERQSNIQIYELADPANPRFVGAYWNRNTHAGTSTAAAGDLGPEGVIFVAEKDSPTGKPLLVVANEISGTTTVWQVD